MAIELSQAPEQVQGQGQEQNEFELKKQMNGEVVQEGVDQQAQLQGQGQMDLELHRACASGSLDDVRAVLSRGLEQLEILDMNTGCTPIVLAIRGNHVDVVRELLSAGAIVPPPGLTNDPTMLSLLYPQPMYGLPPQFIPHQHPHQPMPMSMAPEFYPQSNGFYGNQMQQAQANLPPAEVAKTIPCRNFPNCKYGAACVFFHPRGQAFYPPGQGQGPAGPGQAPFQGYEYQQGFQPMPYFNPAQQPNGFQPQAQEMNGDVPQQQQPFGQSAPSNSIPIPVPGSENDNSVPQQYNETMQHDAPPPPHQHELSSAPAPFVPFGMTSPVPPQFGLSPMSPPMMHMQMAPHEAGFYASSPPNGHAMMAPPPMNGFVPRRLSTNHGPGGYTGKPFAHGHGHGKKPSFSGGSRPWAGAGAGAAGSGPGAGGARSWKDGTPPPCAFFAQSKCRNGEFCKFPHLDQEGNDVRHPDVVRGVMAPAPPLARVTRPRMSMGMGMGMGGFGQFDPTRQFVPRASAGHVNGNGNGNGEEASQLPTPVETIAESSSAPVDPSSTGEEQVQPEAQAQAEAQTQTDAGAKTADLPAKPAATSSIARSASQPGAPRFQPNGHGPNGFHSRSQSPASSNSFHGNGHPRRAGRPFPGQGQNQGQGQGQVAAGAGGRSVSAGDNKQRIPGKDDFPALGGALASGNTSPQEKSAASFSKTAAQVLSAPAPPKPEVAAPAPKESTSTKESNPTTSEDGVTMDDESDSDAVIVNVNKPTEKAEEQASTPAPAAEKAAPAPAKPSTISFASVASAIKEISNSTSSPASNGNANGNANVNGSIDSAPVALKA